MERILDDVRKDAMAKMQMAGEDGTLLIDTAVNIVEMSDVTRREGLLALGAFNEDNNSGFAKWIVMLVVDGTDQDFLCEMAVNEYWMREPKGVCAMADYMYIRGMLCIQEGLNEKILEIFLQTLIPLKLRSAYHKKLREKQKIIEKKKKKENAEKFTFIRPVFQDEKVIEKIHVLENRVSKLSDRDVQRVVRDLNNYCAEICVYAMSRVVREKVLTNMSARYAALVIEDIVHFGSVEESEVLKYIEKTLNIINKLSQRGEIHESDEE